MQREMAYGERPELTSLVGASAAPSQTPAARPHRTPMPCVEVKSRTRDGRDAVRVAEMMASFVAQRSEMSRARPMQKTASGTRK